MTDLKLRLQAKQQMPSYLAELDKLVSQRARVAELLSPEETEALRDRIANTARAPSWRVQIPFSERQQPRFVRLIDQLEELHSQPVYIWTPRSRTCGAHPPVRLSDINFAFPYDINPEGILSFVSADLTNQLLLDFSEDSSGNGLLDIEVSGANWGKARY